MIGIGLSHTSAIVVGDNDTAIAMKSGDMAVLSTPSMIAMLENAAMMAVAPHLPEGSTTVGSHIDVSHSRPSKVGAKITFTATLKAVDNRRLDFDVVAMDGDNEIGRGTHTRFIVDRQRFMARL
jgi:predicted thioesterase